VIVFEQHLGGSDMTRVGRAKNGLQGSISLGGGKNEETTFKARRESAEAVSWRRLDG